MYIYILFSYCTCLCCDIYLSNHIMCIYMFGVIAHVIYFPSFFFSTKHIKIVSIFYHFFFLSLLPNTHEGKLVSSPFSHFPILIFYPSNFPSSPLNTLVRIMGKLQNEALNSIFEAGDTKVCCKLKACFMSAFFFLALCM